MLLAGTNDKNIITFDVKHLLEFEPYNYDGSSMGISEHAFEEEKEMGSMRDDSEYKYNAYEFDQDEEEKEPEQNLDDTEFLDNQEIKDDEQLETIF